jgi:hypothetical protein
MENVMRILVLTAASLGLASYGNATPASPDSNPAHCLAAFNYYAYWFKVGHEPDKVAHEPARGMYVMERVKSDGGSPPVAEGKQFTRTHVKNSSEMDALYVACAKAQAYDPQFRAEFSGLIEKARPLVPQYEPQATRE